PPVPQQPEGTVDRPRARPRDAAGPGLQLLDHLVAVHGPLGQEGQDRGPDVAASAATPPSPAAGGPGAGRHGREGRAARRPEVTEGRVVAQPGLVERVAGPVRNVVSSHAASPPCWLQRLNDISLTLEYDTRRQD